MNAEQPAMDMPSAPVAAGRCCLCATCACALAARTWHGVSFDLAAGEKLALVGESGSGKTITALSLLRLAGDAQLGGQALSTAATSCACPSARCGPCAAATWP